MLVAEPSPFDDASPRDVALYDELPLWSALAGELLLENVTMAGARRILDLGCGTGFPLVELTERVGPATFVAGVDRWFEGLRRANAKIARWTHGNAAVARGDGAALPFRDGTFDLVVSNLGVNNFDDPEATLGECRRVLRAGGRIGLSSNLVGHMGELYAAFEQVLHARHDRAALDRLRRHVEHRATVASLTARLQGAGFRVEAVNEREAVMRFANAEALFSHHFIRFGFRPAWEEIAADAFPTLRLELDRLADEQGAIRLTIPLAYLEATRE
jgi:arsenite methyltransferase